MDMSNLGKYNEKISAGLLKENHFYKIVHQGTGESGLLKILEVFEDEGFTKRLPRAYTFEVIESRKYSKQIHKEIPVVHGFFESNVFYLNPEHHKKEAKKPEQIIHHDILLDELKRIELLGNIDRAIDSGDQALFMELTSQLKTHFVNN